MRLHTVGPAAERTGCILFGGGAGWPFASSQGRWDDARIMDPVPMSALLSRALAAFTNRKENATERRMLWSYPA